MNTAHDARISREEPGRASESRGTISATRRCTGGIMRLASFGARWNRLAACNFDPAEQILSDSMNDYEANYGSMKR